MTDTASPPPRWRLWSVLLAVGAVYTGATFQALADLFHHQTWRWRDMVMGGVLWAVVVGGVRLLQRVGWFPSGPEGPRQRVVVAAVRAGALPPDADVDEWSVRLARMSEQLRQSRWAIAGMCVVIGALVGAAAAEDNGNAGDVWTLAIALAAFAVVPFGVLSARLGAAERLAADLPMPRS